MIGTLVTIDGNEFIIERELNENEFLLRSTVEKYHTITILKSYIYEELKNEKTVGNEFRSNSIISKIDKALKLLDECGTDSIKCEFTAKELDYLKLWVLTGLSNEKYLDEILKVRYNMYRDGE